MGNNRNRRLSRREMLKFMALGGGAAYLSACVAPGAAPAPAEAPAAPAPSPSAAKVLVNSGGREMPPDAAPLDQQIFREMSDAFGTHIEFIKTVYNTAPGARRCQIALTRMNMDFEIEGEAAESWEVSPDGLTWTFKIRKGLEWSDGKPLNAHDFVWTFQRAANPKTAYDAGFMFSLVAGIKNFSKVEKGDLPVDQVGVVAPDDYTLQVTTETPRPFLPQPLKEAACSPKQMFDKYGEDWAADVKTMVFSGPYQVAEWVHQDHVLLRPNPSYHGPFKPYLEQYKTLYGQAAAAFPAYLNNEVDLVVGLAVADLRRAESDAGLKDALHSWPHWQEYYITPDTQHPPFDNLKLRQALSHAIDIETLCKTTLKGTATPNHTMLMPGFPAYSADLQKVQGYDAELAKKLMAEAGYPDGKGFPQVELWARDSPSEAPLSKPAGEFIQAELKKNLGIDIGFRMVERKSFTDSINKHDHNFFMVPYEYDYVDPSDLLDLWLPGSRHAWQNDKYTELVTKADGMISAQADRIPVYQEAEKILVEDVGGIFLFTPVKNALWRPYLRGKSVTPNKYGLTPWDDDSALWAYQIYVGQH